jgi:hypothetical protein
LRRTLWERQMPCHKVAAFGVAALPPDSPIPINWGDRSRSRARQGRDDRQRIVTARPQGLDSEHDRADQVSRQQVGARIGQRADALAGNALIVGLTGWAQIEQEYVEIAEVAYSCAGLIDRRKPTYAPAASTDPKRSRFPMTARGLIAELNFPRRAVAERVGFEPTVGFHPRRFSRPLP